MLTPGSKLGSYEIVGPIGAGGMGEVYRARDTKLNRDVALKVLPEAFTLDQDRVARFKREAQVLASLNHPNIATIYGLEEADGIHGIVMELVEGPTLADRVKAGAVRFDEALSIARQMAHALEAAHEKGVVHRDLKPANVKVTPEGKVKVLDFGLAKLADPTEAGPYSNTDSPTLSVQATRAGVILGTAAYMSPEQARGQTVDKRVDIWAFGCVFYELLTGHHPFKADTVSDVAARILEREPDWHALSAGVPEPIQKLLKRCLRKDPVDRLHDIADARLEIEDVLSTSQRGPAAVPPTPASRVSRRGVGLGLATLGLIAVALGALFSVRFLSLGPTVRGGTVTSESFPLVIMMDSGNPARVYDQETRAADGTNADVISDILSDLPLRRQKEAIGPEWHRDEEIRRFQPDLIIIHYSGFNQEDSSGPRERLKLLIKFFAATQTRFLIYSRAREVDLNANLSTLLADLYAEHPGLHGRIRGFGLLDHGPPRWVNTVTGTELKLVVKELLHLR